MIGSDVTPNFSREHLRSDINLKQILPLGMKISNQSEGFYTFYKVKILCVYVALD